MTEGSVSPVPKEARPYQGERAGVVTRMVAGILDAVLVVIALVGSVVGVNVVSYMLDPRGFEFTAAAPLTSVTAALLVTVGYLTVAWATSGRSYGGHVMGLRVVSRGDHRLLGPARALLRAVLCALFPIGILWCVGPAHRSVQDLATGSSVVYDWSPRGQRGQRGRQPE
jgi:uncharacterized RDD family membrane protein YckC